VENGLKTEWFQDDHFVVINFTDITSEGGNAKEIDTIMAKVDFESRGLVIEMNSFVTYWELFGEVDPKESFYEFKYDNKILVVTLSKNIKKLSWSSWRL